MTTPGAGADRSQVARDRAVALKEIHFGMALAQSRDMYNPNYHDDEIKRHLDREYPLPCQACSGRVEVPEDVKRWAKASPEGCYPGTLCAATARWILSLAEGAK